MKTPKKIRVGHMSDRAFDRTRNLRFLGFLLKQPFAAGPGLVSWLAWWVFLGIAARDPHVHPGVTLFALGPVFGFGLAMMFGLGGFWLVRRLGPEGPAWLPDASPAVDSPELREIAIHYSGAESREGTLYLTSREWVFVPGRYAIDRTILRILRTSVSAIQWYRSPPLEEPTSTMVLERADGDVELVFGSLDRASKVAEAGAEASATAGA